MSRPCYVEIEGLGEAKVQFHNLAGGYTSVCEIDTGFIKVKGEATAPYDCAPVCAHRPTEKDWPY